MSKEKLIIIFTVAVDVIGLGIIIPVLPLYVESFGTSAFTVTLLFSVFSLFSFVSAPFLGALSDKIGRRPVLMASILSTSLGWFIFSFAKSLPVLFLGRIIDGAAAGNFSTAQSSIADLSKDDKERTANLGIIGMIFGLGFIVGPFIGGILSKVSHSFPFLFVGALALLNVILAYFFLPETNRHIDHDKKLTANPFKPLAAAVKNRTLRPLYLIWFIFNVVAVSANSIFALFLYQAFGFSAFTAGLFFTGIGIVLALNQGLFIRRFWLKRFKEKQLILMMLGAFALAYFLNSLRILPLFIIGLIIGAFGQSTLNVAMTSEIIGQADIKERGEAVGVLSGIASAAMVVAPLLSGATFTLNPSLPYIISAVLSALAFLLMYKIHTNDRHPSPDIEAQAREVI
ncbi:MAG TPA: MFS transporter [Patescibacteria group bacterium]